MAHSTKNRQKSQKIKKYKKPLNLNIGMIIFSAIFIYVLVCVIMYFRQSHIVGYVVMEGSLSTNTIYRGVALREETVVTTDSAGYVNYYAREGERVAAGDLVYTVDETGKLKEYIEDASLGENTLSNQDLAGFRSDIVNFIHNFDPSNYGTAYDFKYSMKNTVLKLANTSIMEGIVDINGSSELTSLVIMGKSPETGIVSYWKDGYETLSADMITDAILSETGYAKEQLIGNDLIAIGDAAFKLSTNENWAVIIAVDEERGMELEAEEYIKVRFLKNQYESWAGVKLLRNGDGNTYLQLSFTNSMITFTSERFLDIELILNDDTGLKIPISSIMEKEFFLVPEEYIAKSEENQNVGVIRQSYLEDGSTSQEFVETDVYNYDEETKEYYLDTLLLESGDVILKPDGQDIYTISKKGSLIGVYNMNKGYADFRQIIILYQNEEYAIVQSNTRYGLNVYDHIVLNAASVSDDQFIYE